MRKIFFIIPLLIFAFIFYFSLSGKLSLKENNERKGKYNLLIITIDTLRADRLGCYGFRKNTSPAIDKFADESLLFENAIVQVPFTGPSHASLFTGKYVINHGVLSNGYKLPDENLTLAEILKDSGYTTGGFIASYILKEAYNFNQGFDVYRG
ncbi:MAG: hypothetical protein D6734_09810, partial [Candidatus Schekmanbacteria bacterium]